jgi:hypothetical protein
MLDLSTVFVQPDVIEAPSLPEDIEALEQRLSLEEARDSLLENLQAQIGGERVAAESVIREHSRCAIVGPPGSGKTTLLQHLLLAITKGELSFGSSTPLIPVLMKVRQLNQQPLPPVDDLLQLTESRIFSGTRPGFLDRQFHAGNVVLLIDGMDEIVDEQREALFNWIEDLVGVYHKARYVVSSRPAGYQASVFQHLGFRECHLCEFTDDQIRDYVRRWTQAVVMAEGATPEEAEVESTRSADSLVDRAEQNPYVRQVATNPLLLSTLCLVQRYEGGELPNRRVVLYERCVEGLLFHWDNKRGLPPELIGELPLEQKMLLLRRLALQMQTEGGAEIDEKQVESTFGTALSHIGNSADPAEILRNIQDRSGLLVERRPGFYSFSHLTFQEYLAALAIKEGDDMRYDRLFLFGKRNDRQWREVISLYAGLAPQDAIEEFLIHLLNDGEVETLLLCGECLLAAVTPHLELQQNVIRTLLGLPHDIETDQESRLDAILAAQNSGVMFEEALVALNDLSRGHALRYLSGRIDSRLIETLERIAEQELSTATAAGTWGPAIMVDLIDLAGTPEAQFPDGFKDRIRHAAPGYQRFLEGWLSQVWEYVRKGAYTHIVRQLKVLVYIVDRVEMRPIGSMYDYQLQGLIMVSTPGISSIDGDYGCSDIYVHPVFDDLLGDVIARIEGELDGWIESRLDWS